MSTTNTDLRYSKFEVAHESRYIRTHNNEKLSNISDCTFAILSEKKIPKYPNKIDILSPLKYISLDITIRCAS